MSVKWSNALIYIDTFVTWANDEQVLVIAIFKIYIEMLEDHKNDSPQKELRNQM